MKKTQDIKQLGIIGILLFLAAILVVGFLLVQDSPTDETKTNGTNGPTNDEVAPVAPNTEDTDQTPEAEQTAKYRVKYNVPWSTDTHPNTLPLGAHVSPIVVVAHTNENSLFVSDTIATDGIEIMAEIGATKVLTDEIENDPSILGPVIGTRIDVPGSNTLEIELDQDHSLLSAVSMLAPSPDWFVGTNSVELFEDGQWLEEIELPMKPYDAGTDSEETFTTDDSDTNPAETIGPPADNLFVDAAAENDFATITITKI